MIGVIVMAEIGIGDFIKAKGLAYCGVVTGKGFIGKYAAWKVRGPRGETSAILKAHAELICANDEELEKQWQRQQEEK